MKTCYIYTRTAAISSGDAAKKHRSSAMTKQIAACQNYAKKHNYKVLEILEDVDSGNNFNRKGLQKLLTSCKQKSVDAVVILKIDRLSRKVADYAKIRSMLEKQDIKLISVLEGNLNGGSNSFIGNIFAAVGQWESEKVKNK